MSVGGEAVPNRDLQSRDADVVDDAASVNRSHWDARTLVHAASEFYDLDGVVRDGPRPIFGPDEDEVGDVAGKTLLHLQCHLGTDSLRWAALGAEVVGVDFSAASIEVACQLSATTGLAASFVHADVMTLPSTLPGVFDIVYASYGVLCWIADLNAWAAIAASYVREGGIFYLADGHPFDTALEPDRYARAGYFDRSPHRYEDASSYTDSTAPLEVPANVRWHHTIGDIVSAVAGSGLRIEYLHENPWAPRKRDPQMIEDAHGRWQLPGDPYPMAFSLQACKPRT